MSDPSKTSDETRVVEVHFSAAAGRDVMNMLVEVWLCAFSNGAVWGLTRPGPVAGPVAYDIAVTVRDEMRGDRLRVEEIHEDIARHLRDLDITGMPDTPPGSPT